MPRQRADELRAEAIAAWIAGLFPERRYPAAFVGSSNGGIVHLAAAPGCPWLPPACRRLLAESFALMAPLAALQRRLVPSWLLFNTEPSARSLRRWLDETPASDEIGQMLFSHGTEGIGVTPIETWRVLLGRVRRRGLFLGVDEARYPRGFATFVRCRRDLDRLGAEQDPPQPLAPDRFEGSCASSSGGARRRDERRRARTSPRQPPVRPPPPIAAHARPVTLGARRTAMSW